MPAETAGPGDRGAGRRAEESGLEAKAGRQGGPEDSEAPGVGVRAAGAGESRPRAEASGSQVRDGERRGEAEAGMAGSGRRGGAVVPDADVKDSGHRAAAAARDAEVADSGRRSGVAARDADVADPEAQAEVAVRDAISAPDAEGRPRRVTRRFPLFTRDTARPEGGGRAAPGDAPAPARQWPILAVITAVGLGLLLTALDQFRYGCLLIGVALLVGAALRWTLPDVGMLAVRSRFTDIVTYGLLGTAIILLAMMAQPNPWLEIPFLKDTLHFTVDS